MSMAKKRSVVAAFLLFMVAQSVEAFTTLNKSDPYPLYSAAYPVLYQHVPACGMRYNQNPFDIRASIDVSPFFLKASRGRNADNERVALGDLEGRWNVIGLTYNPSNMCPQSPILQNAATEVFSSGLTFNDPAETDPTHNLGFMSAPFHLRKAGVRGQAFIRFCEDFSLTVQGGFDDLRQTQTGFFDNTPFAPTEPSHPCGITAYTCSDKQLVEQTLTSQFYEIAQQLGYDVSDYYKSSIEDIAWSIDWRHAFECNACNPCWDRFLFIPFIALDGRLAVASPICQRQLLAVPVSNNGHNSLGIAAGLHLDFYGTLEAGVTVGYDHFFSKTVCDKPMPTNEFQSGIFPCMAAAKISPGRNFYMMGTIHAHDFIERVSMFAEYIFITHAKDKICLLEPNTSLLPCVLEERSTWSNQSISIGITYVMCPNLSISGLWQAPIAQRNSYRSNTGLLTLTGSFICGVSCCF